MIPLRVMTLLLLATAALAQTDTGVMAGTITDASGAVVPGAQVTARNQNTGLRFTGVANESGNFVISALPPGVYAVAVSAPGFAGASRSGVTLNVQTRLEVNFSLRVGDVAEVVQVTAATPVLET